jgi:hypothetical protein
LVDPLNDDLLDQAMRRRVLEVTQRLGARPEDMPALGQAREDALPFCWSAPEGGWHLTVRERDRLVSDRHTTDPDEFVFWIAARPGTLNIDCSAASNRHGLMRGSPRPERR